MEVIRHIVRNSKFDTAIKEKLESSVDLETYETEETAVKVHIRQLTAAKDRLGKQIDRLDYSDKHYEEKYNDMQNRMDSLYDEIAEANDSLETVKMQIQGIREQQITQERVYEFLELFDIIPSLTVGKIKMATNPVNMGSVAVFYFVTICAIL